MVHPSKRGCTGGRRRARWDVLHRVPFGNPPPAGALTAVLAAFALTVVNYPDRPEKVLVTGKQLSPSRSSASSAASRLKFPPAAGPIPHRATFAGTGK